MDERDQQRKIRHRVAVLRHAAEVTGNVEAMRVLRVARLSARKARTQALNRMRSLISTAPDEIRKELRDLNAYRMLEGASTYRPGQQHVVTHDWAC